MQWAYQSFFLKLLEIDENHIVPCICGLKTQLIKILMIKKKGEIAINAVLQQHWFQFVSRFTVKFGRLPSLLILQRQLPRD